MGGMRIEEVQGGVISWRMISGGGFWGICVGRWKMLEDLCLTWMVRCGVHKIYLSGTVIYQN